MTSAEYKSLYAKARKAWPSVQLETMKGLRKVYIQAADEAAAVVRRTEAAELSVLTSNSWRNIENQLRAGADTISRAVETDVPKLVTDCYYMTERRPGIGRIDVLYLQDAFAAVSGIDFVTSAGLENLSRGIKNRLMVALVTQEWPDGYVFSERVWGGLNAQYQRDMKNLIQVGIAQGRDVTQIARDLEVYARYNKDYVFRAGRYGKLKPGTAEYKKRIGRAIDYRALRLARSELYSAMQTAAAWQGQANPGCEDLYDWTLNGGRQSWPCLCPDLASGSPYRYNQIPAFPHPLCQCILRARLRGHTSFMDDLKAWSDGSSVDYLDDWYNNFYLPAQI